MDSKKTQVKLNAEDFQIPGIFCIFAKRNNMEDKDKIILVTYVGIKNLGSEGTILDHLVAIDAMIRSAFDSTVKTLIVPRRDTDETWVECINPQLVSEEKYKEAEEAVENLNKLLKEKR